MGEKDTLEEEEEEEEEDDDDDAIPSLIALIDEYPSLEKISDADEGTGGKTAFFSSLADFVDKVFLLLFFSSITTAAVAVEDAEVDDGG